MTESKIESLIKAYEELTNELKRNNPDLDTIWIIEERITALIAEYREKRRFVNVYREEDEWRAGAITRNKKVLGDVEFSTREDAFQQGSDSDKYLETIEIIRL